MDIAMALSGLTRTEALRDDATVGAAFGAAAARLGESSRSYFRGWSAKDLVYVSSHSKVERIFYFS